MTNILFIEGNPKSTEQSYSLRLGESFLKAYQDAHQDATVTRLDLYEDHIPLIDAEVMTGWGKLAQQQELSHHEAHKVQRLGELVDQFVAADLVVFAVPMWNFGYPPMVKAYIDAIAVAGKTFKYTETGVVGLAGGKKVVIAEARGGIYTQGPFQGMQYGENHLRGILGFMGVTDIETVVVEGVAFTPDQAEQLLSAAVGHAQQLAQTLAVTPRSGVSAPI
jgi:FMN-dependent NADH-azoreductase